MVLFKEASHMTVKSGASFVRSSSSRPALAAN